MAQPRNRFSLLTTLLTVTTLAAVVGLAGAYRQNRQLASRNQSLDEENRRLRAERGELTIDDPTKLYAIRLPDAGRGVWRYRVYLPEGHRYYVALQANNLPRAGEPPRYGGTPPDLNTTRSGLSDRGGPQTANGCSAGEFLATVTLGRDDRGEKYVDATLTPVTPSGAQGARIGTGIGAIPGKWPAVETEQRGRGQSSIGQSTTGVPERHQREKTVDQTPLVLFDRRYMYDAVTSSADSEEGVIAWIGVAGEAEPAP